MTWLAIGLGALVILAAYGRARARGAADRANLRAIAAEVKLRRRLGVGDLKVHGRPLECGCCEIPAQTVLCPADAILAEIESQGAQ